jgi:hypothetical protein
MDLAFKSIVYVGCVQSGASSGTVVLSEKRTILKTLSARSGCAEHDGSESIVADPCFDKPLLMTQVFFPEKEGNPREMPVVRRRVAPCAIDRSAAVDFLASLADAAVASIHSGTGSLLVRCMRHRE